MVWPQPLKQVSGASFWSLSSPDALRGSPLSEGFENYIAVKKRADDHLVGTDLNWVETAAAKRRGLLAGDSLFCLCGQSSYDYPKTTSIAVFLGWNDTSWLRRSVCTSRAWLDTVHAARR
ncbi:hypothetical protein EMIT0P43_10043 [Pseudomonas jessenii]